MPHVALPRLRSFVPLRIAALGPALPLQIAVLGPRVPPRIAVLGSGVPLQVAVLAKVSFLRVRPRCKFGPCLDPRAKLVQGFSCGFPPERRVVPVQPLWLPLLRTRKNFLCYIGRGQVLWSGQAVCEEPLPLRPRSSTMISMGWAAIVGYFLTAPALGTPIAAVPPDARYCRHAGRCWAYFGTVRWPVRSVTQTVLSRSADPQGRASTGPGDRAVHFGAWLVSSRSGRNGCVSCVGV